jgi:hypothetical protein
MMFALFSVPLMRREWRHGPSYLFEVGWFMCIAAGADLLIWLIPLVS